MDPLEQNSNISESLEPLFSISPKDIISARFAEKICQKYAIIFSGNTFFQYTRGCYKKISEEELKKIILLETGDLISKFKINEICSFIEIHGHIKESALNNQAFLNLNNGLLNLYDFKLEPHSPIIYSTIQLNVGYQITSKCLKWTRTLREIFEGDEEKICLLQEFFGLCLTSETKYEKALVLIGEGANGKSVILYILQKLLGEDNYSAIPLEKFNNTHYTANLFGKLANISIETNAKSEVYDSVFKATVSGDQIEADHKFGRPFKFSPICKLVFALNNMPRVDDKTDAFFRRLIIIRFNKCFSELEQNKNLKFELLEELDGILLWSLEGLERLRERGYFSLPESVQDEIEEYKKDNNNVLLFVEDTCQLKPESTITKGYLYDSYSSWCLKNGYRPIGKKRFGNALSRHFNAVGEDKTNAGWIWTGLTLNQGGTNV